MSPPQRGLRPASVIIMTPAPRPNVLVLSDLFPTPGRPAYGIFVERQTTYTHAFCDHVVVSPTRIFPHLRIWKQWRRLDRFATQWREWRHEMRQVPAYSEQYGYPVYYPRYTSPPHQLSHALWGFFAYPAMHSLLRRLHASRPFDLVHAHYGTPAGVVALLARRWMHVPVVVSVHGTDVTYTAPQNRFGRAVTRWALRGADQVIVNSSWTARRVEHYAGPVGPEVVYLGGDLATPAAPQARPHGAPLTLLSVGYVEKRKGHIFVLRALRQLIDEGHHLRYVVVGDGSALPEIREVTDRLGLGSYVSFEGYKAHAEVGPYFANCDIFVLPSWEEAFGIAYIEALGQGKPVVGCAGQGGPDDLHRLGDCVELVQPRDVPSLADGLRRLIHDPLRRKQMGETGRKIVAEHFTWANNAQKTFAIYQRLICERRNNDILHPPV